MLQGLRFLSARMGKPLHEALPFSSEFMECKTEHRADSGWEVQGSVIPAPTSFSPTTNSLS